MKEQDQPDIELVHARGLARVVELVLDGVCVITLVLLAVITTVDVVGRYVFNAPLQGAYESSELLLAVLVFSCLPRVTWHRQHLTVSMIDSLLKRRGLRIQRAVVALVTTVALATLAWHLWQLAAQKAEYGDMSHALQTPIAPFAYAAAALTGLSALAALLGLWVRTSDPTQTSTPMPTPTPAQEG